MSRQRVPALLMLSVFLTLAVAALLSAQITHRQAWIVVCLNMSSQCVRSEYYFMSSR